MTNFLIDNNNSYSYEDLLNDLNNSKFYYPQFKTNNLYEFFLNFLVALISNNNLILIDSDLNNSEIEKLGYEKINSLLPRNQSPLLTFDQVLERIKNSTSEISIFTSGTTGQPKKVIHNIQMLTRTIRVSEKFIGQIWGFAYNPTHMAGIQVFFQAFFNKNTLINIFKKTRKDIFDLIHYNSITNISATPTFYRLLLPIERSFESINRITFGGEKSDKKLHEAILKIFPNAKINNIYASTEAGSLFFSNGEDFQIPFNISDKIKVEEGELLIHNSLLGISDSFSFTDNFYRTGDLIEWINEKNGLFRFKGRKNEIINIGGYKVNPLEVENCILEIADVLQVCVFSKPNSVLGNVLCAEVKTTKSSKLTELEIRKFLLEKLQDFKIPRRIKFVETFSLTGSGKIKRI